MADHVLSKRKSPDQAGFLTSPHVLPTSSPLAAAPMALISTPHGALPLPTARSIHYAEPIPLINITEAPPHAYNANAHGSCLAGLDLDFPPTLWRDVTLLSNTASSTQQWNTKCSSLHEQLNGISSTPVKIAPARLDAPTPAPEKFTFVGENPAFIASQTKKRLRTGARQAVQSTIDAGGACVRCQVKKKACGPEIPCVACRRNHTLCIRGSSSLCLALTVKNHLGHVCLDPANFHAARNILWRLKRDSSIYLTTVVVEWTVCHVPQQGQRTWTVDVAQLDLRSVESAVKAWVVDIALSLDSTVHLDRSGFSDNLSVNAFRMLKLLAAIDQLSRSTVIIQNVTAGIARLVLFYLTSIYAMEVFDVSLCFANELYGAMRDRRVVKYSARYAVRVYSRVIDGILNFQRSESLIPAVFAQIRPQLMVLQGTIQQLLSSTLLQLDPNVNDPWVPDIPDLQACNITIRLIPEATETAFPVGSRQTMYHDQLRYAIDVLLRTDFDESVNKPYTVAQTIDPQLLSPQIGRQNPTVSSAASTDLYSVAGYDNIFSSADGNSQDTGITYSHPDLYTCHFDMPTAEYPGNNSHRIQVSAREDFQHIGDHLCH